MSFTPPDGQITSLPILGLTLIGSEVQEIVSPGNAAEGNSYQVTTAMLAAFYSTYSILNREVITAGATLASPYMVLPTDTQIFFNKTLGAPSYAVCAPAATMLTGGVLFKDFKGDANINPITITFTGTETCDGQGEIVIDNAYGWIFLSHGPGLGAGGTGWCVIGT